MNPIIASSLTIWKWPKKYFILLKVRQFHFCNLVMNTGPTYFVNVLVFMTIAGRFRQYLINNILEFKYSGRSGRNFFFFPSCGSLSMNWIFFQNSLWIIMRALEAVLCNALITRDRIIATSYGINKCNLFH